LIDLSVMCVCDQLHKNLLVSHVASARTLYCLTKALHVVLSTFCSDHDEGINL